MGGTHAGFVLCHWSHTPGLVLWCSLRPQRVQWTTHACMHAQCTRLCADATSQNSCCVGVLTYSRSTTLVRPLPAQAVCHGPAPLTHSLAVSRGPGRAMCSAASRGWPTAVLWLSPTPGLLRQPVQYQLLFEPTALYRFPCFPCHVYYSSPQHAAFSVARYISYRHLLAPLYVQNK